MKEHIKPVDFVRWALTALLIVGIHSETGIWTTVFAVLVALVLEGQTLLNRMLTGVTKQFVELFEKAGR